MDSQNERLMMRLKAIEMEYYSIEKLKNLEQHNVHTLVFCSTAIY